ncbi:MAG: ACP S-malonyltransferase [Candidatus Omnitrophica bacterium]|nr:ACP S-malonyltransferase [Candidatus Omnitrophota bacterium]
MTKTAFLFAGQGAQYVGMGRDLYEAYPESRRIFEAADKALEFPLSSLCFEGPHEELTRTHNCQPAVLTVSIAAWEAFRVRDAAAADAVAGLSLGEYSALTAAGALDFKDAVRLVRRRGEFMEEAAGEKQGKMLSVIGLDRETVRDITGQSHTEIANLNCPGQIVISGGVEEIARAQALAEQKGAKMTVALEVSGAFHSSFMNGAAKRLAQELQGVTVRPPRVPVISNVTALTVGSPDEIRQNLTRQVAGSVLWEDSMNLLTAQGVGTFFEFGPGKVLKGLMRRINREVTVTTIETAEDIARLSQAKGAEDAA